MSFKNKQRRRNRLDLRIPRLISETLEMRRLLSGSLMNLLPLGNSTGMYSVPAASADLAVGHDGDLWYTAGNSLQRISQNGLTSVFAIPAGSGGVARAIVSNVAISTDNSAWLVVADGGGVASNRIEHLTSAGQFADVTGIVAAPIRNLAAGSGALWFTRGDDAIGKLAGAASAQFYTVAGVAGFAGLAVDAQGDAWFVGQNTAGGGLVGEVTVAGVVTTFSVAAHPGGITAGSDGNMYFAAEGAIWRLAGNGDMTKIPVPGELVQSLTIGADGSFWFLDANSATHSINRVAADGGVIQFVTPGGGIPNSLQVAPDGGVWYLATGASAGSIGKVGGRTLSLNGVTSIASNGNSISLSTTAAADIVLSSFDSVTPLIHINGAVTPDNQGSTSNNSSGTTSSAGSSATESSNNTSSGAITSGGLFSGQSDATSPHDDPGVFEGEFSIVAATALPPTQNPHPYDRYESKLDTRPPTFASAMSTPEVTANTTPATVRLDIGKPFNISARHVAPGVVSSSLALMASPDQTIHPSAAAMAAGVYPAVASLTMQASAQDSPQGFMVPPWALYSADSSGTASEGSDSFGSLWRFTACMSVAPEIQARRQAPLRRVYW